MITRILSTLFCLLSLVSVANAQALEQYLSIESIPSWVTPVEAPAASEVENLAGETIYLLVEEQVSHQEKTSSAFFRQARHLLTPSAVEDNATITVSFDPAYHTVSFHHLRRTRNGETQDVLDPQLFDVYRIETDRERLIYNGDLQLSYLIPDVRVGDTIEYAYSISGRNPATRDHFGGYFQHAYAVPIERHYERLLVPSGLQPNFKSISDDVKPEVSNLDQTTEFVWDRKSAAIEGAEDNLPAYHSAYPQHFYSSYKDWAEVGAYFAIHYEVSGEKPAELVRVTNAIIAQHSDQTAQLREALDFVQREIRYLGIELGVGGYIPRHPAQVLKNRFGDCKDMTLLLIALLEELNIQAQPLLVSSQAVGYIDEVAPSHSAFDHVIVLAQLGENTYYLDPTRGVQLGDLDHLQQGDFGKGVVISKDGPGLIEMYPPRPSFWKDFEDTFDLVTEPGAILLTSTSTYFKNEADRMRAWYQRDGLASIEKSFFEHYQNLFPQIEQTSALEISVDEEKAKTRVTGHYRIPDAWTVSDAQKIREFYAPANDVLSDIPSFVGADRTMAYAWVHPVRTQHKLTFLLDETWQIDNSSIVITQPAFEFKKRETFFDNIYTNTVSYSTRAPEVAASDFKDTMADIRRARELVGVTLTVNDGGNESPIWRFVSQIDDIDTKSQLWFVVSALLALIGAIALKNRDVEWRANQVYYPVSLFKFSVMTFVSLGVYPLFWVYKNWQWIQEVQDENVGPILRTFFAPLTNFGLFLRISKQEGSNIWFRPISVFLALTILVGTIVDRVLNSSEHTADIFVVISIVCLLAWLPVAAQVNRLNVSHGRALHRDYGFSWPSVLFILMYLPVGAVSYFGFYLILQKWMTGVF